MGRRYEQKDNAYAPDSIAAHDSDSTRPLDSANYVLTDGIYYDVAIGSPKTGRVAYKKRDSAWVILDSAETLKQLLYMVDQQSKLYR